MRILYVLLASCGVAAFAWSPSSNPSTGYEYHAEIGDADRVWLYWDIDTTKQTITFEVRATTTGFFGLGFSKNGGMQYADIIVGWIDSNGKPQISDRHGRADAGFPPQDKSQDYHLIGGVKQNGKIIMAFSRKLDTCDDQDFVIGKNTMRVIWTINSHVPANADDIIKHTPENRGTRSIYFMDVHNSSPPPTGKDIGTYEVRAHNVSLPDDYHSLFWCHVVQKPDTGKVHMIRYEPIIQPGNEPYVHHMVLFACTHNMSEWLNKEEYCFDPSDNPTHFSAMGKCTQVFLAAWAIGDNAHIYPADVGYPMFEEGGPTFYMLQTHYDNHAYHKNITDSSGLRIYFTHTLREKEAALLTVGNPPAMVFPTIPPDMALFNSYGICPSACTKTFPGPIQVFSGFLHMHLIGRVLKVRLIRNGVELKPLFDDGNWDFNYQQVRMLAIPRTIQPGDDIQVECGYVTSGHKNATFGGDSTINEMCFAFMEYWPKPKNWIEFCLSRYDVGDVLGNFFNLKNFTFTGFNQAKVQLQDGTWMTYRNFINSQNWNELDSQGNTMKQNYQNYIKKVQQNVNCDIETSKKFAERQSFNPFIPQNLAHFQANKIRGGVFDIDKEATINGTIKVTHPWKTPPRCQAPNVKTTTQGASALAFSFTWILGMLFLSSLY